jgi:hypothetical protein
VVCLNGRAGGVMLAATGRRSITISNAGALAVAYDVKVCHFTLISWNVLASNTQQKQEGHMWNAVQLQWPMLPTACISAQAQVTGALAATTKYEEPDPGTPPLKATADEMACSPVCMQALLDRSSGCKHQL